MTNTNTSMNTFEAAGPVPPPVRLEDIPAAPFVEGNRSRVHGAGIDLFEYELVTADIDTLADWAPRLLARSDHWVARARAADTAQQTAAAIDGWLAAARWAHFAGCLPQPDPATLARAVGTAADSYRHAVALRDQDALWLESSDPHHPFVGVLRRPAGRLHCPLVIIVPGLDSAKEEFDTLATVLLNRGAAVLSIDGPGQGELANRTSPSERYEDVIAAVLDSIHAITAAQDERIDLDRVGLIGLSLGGFYVLRAAANDQRVRATVDVSGVAQVNLATCLPLIRDTIVRRCRSATAAARFAATIDGPAAAADIRTPLLVVAGGADIIPLPAEARQIVDAAPHGELLWSENGDHLLGNRIWEWRSEAVTWLLDHLDDTQGH